MINQPKHNSRGLSHSNLLASERKSRSGRRKRHRTTKRESLVSNILNIREPIISCHRCGERFHVSWSKDRHCPKCGRRPAKIQVWEAALCALFPPAALVSAFIHKKDSPRATLVVLLLGTFGVLLHAGIFKFLFPIAN